MKRALIAAAAGLLLSISTSACSQPYGMGPGMMGDGWGQGGGWGMGPGMMGGYGPGGGCGPGMMGGWGMGPGMMGGYGPGWGMGPGMMGGWGPGGLNLSEEQRNKLAEADRELAAKQRALMESMHALRWGSADLYPGGKFDEQAARKAFDAMADLRKQMFELSLQAQKNTDAILTPQQREQLRQGWRGR